MFNTLGDVDGLQRKSVLDIDGHSVSPMLECMAAAASEASSRRGRQIQGFQVRAGPYFAAFDPETWTVLVDPRWTESDVAHELAHVLMICEGYPTTWSACSDKEARSIAGNIDGVAHHLQVITRMHQFGFQDDFTRAEAEIESWFTGKPLNGNAFQQNLAACAYAEVAHR